jgi:hypothetical protein
MNFTGVTNPCVHFRTLQCAGSGAVDIGRAKSYHNQWSNMGGARSFGEASWHGLKEGGRDMGASLLLVHTNPFTTLRNETSLALTLGTYTFCNHDISVIVVRHVNPAKFHGCRKLT